MTTESFLKPRLVGERFEGGQIPLEILADFAVLSEMIIEVAKWRYREAHPERKRLPRGFADGVSLKLVGIGEGSAIPHIVLAFTALIEPTLYENNPPAEQYLYEARTAVIDAIAAAEQGKSITEYLPPGLLGYFNRFGRNLGENEAIEFLEGREQSKAARLTKETRRKLALASSEDGFMEETSVYGLVHEADQRAKTFQLTLPNGATLGRIPLEAQHHDTVLEAFTGLRENVRVRIFGAFRFDRFNRLQGIETVEHVSVLHPLDIEARLDELRLLKHGWLNGKGVPPDHRGLDWLLQVFNRFYLGWDDDDLPLPYLYPTAEGRVRAEWSLGMHEISIEVDLQTKQGQWHSLNLADDAEVTETLNLDTKKGWIFILNEVSDRFREAHE